MFDFNIPKDILDKYYTGSWNENAEKKEEKKHTQKWRNSGNILLIMFIYMIVSTCRIS